MPRSNQAFVDANRHLSREHQHWLSCIQRYIQNNPMGYPSNLSDLMGICGFTVDFESIRLYQSFHALLCRQRKNTDDLFKILIDEGVVHQVYI